MNYSLNPDEMHSIIKLASSSSDLLKKLKDLPQSEHSTSNVSLLTRDLEDYFEKTGSSIAQIIRYRSKPDRFEVSYPHKSGLEFEELLVEGCVFYMLPKEDY